MKKIIILSSCIILCVVLVAFFLKLPSNLFTSDQDIKLAARRASVQVQFHIPVMKVWFANPLPEQKKFTEADLIKVLDEKIKDAIKAERELQGVDKYNPYLTNVSIYYRPISRGEIPIGGLAGIPKWAKFPSRILLVYKTEKQEINPSEKKYEADVLSISETTGVSISKAQEMLTNLKGKGYSITKEETVPEADLMLLWFKGGWDSTYPTELKWSVSVLGQKKNYLKGYDDRGIILTHLIPEDASDTSYTKKASIVRVDAGYFDLKEEFKPKSTEVERMLKDIEVLKKELQERIDKEKKESPKRNISTVTWEDVFSGTVKINKFWVYTAASGIFLGNLKVRSEMTGAQFYNEHYLAWDTKGCVLTNAHVAEMTEQFKIYISDDKEIMYILFPGVPSIRYTQNSDMYGTPAQLLFVDNSPVKSWDYDCAIMVTSKVSQYEGNKVILGDSDKVNEGDKVISVGNPMEMQKFLTEGVVSNREYSILKSRLSDYWLKKLDRSALNWLLNSNFWYECTIGIGGTSGSGVWAMSGSQRSRVVALHNMGMVTITQSSFLASGEVDIKPSGFDSLLGDYMLQLKDFVKKYKKYFFDPTEYKTVKFDRNLLAEKETYPKKMLESLGHVEVAGMNGAVPINPIKKYLQERGFDPKHFEFDSAGKSYWEK